jgi:hypothetical protein
MPGLEKKQYFVSDMRFESDLDDTEEGTFAGSENTDNNESGPSNQNDQGREETETKDYGSGEGEESEEIQDSVKDDQDEDAFTGHEGEEGGTDDLEVVWGEDLDFDWTSLGPDEDRNGDDDLSLEV